MKKFWASFCLCAVASSVLFAAENTLADVLRASVDGGMGWDSNLYAAPSLDTGGNVDPDRVSSLYLFGGATLGADLGKWLEAGKQVKRLDLNWIGQYNWYERASTENNATYRVNFASHLAGDDWNLKFENNFLFVQGNLDSPIYEATEINAFSVAYPRERRRQFQDRGIFLAERRLGKWFVAPVSTWTYIDMRTQMKQEPGYKNFLDRSDINGGLNIGREVAEKTRVFGGYRYGYQYQASLPWQNMSATNDYQRLIAGVKTSFGRWKLEGELGPTFISFTPERQAGMAKDLCRLYADVGLGYDVDEAQTIRMSYRQSEAVSSTSPSAYVYYIATFGYTNKLTQSLSCSAQLRWVLGDYEKPSTVSDGVLTPSLSAQWQFAKHFSVRVSYEYNMGYTNNAPSIGRDFARNCVFFTVNAAY